MYREISIKQRQSPCSREHSLSRVLSTISLIHLQKCTRSEISLYWLTTDVDSLNLPVIYSALGHTSLMGETGIIEQLNSRKGSFHYLLCFPHFPIYLYAPHCVSVVQTAKLLATRACQPKENFRTSITEPCRRFVWNQKTHKLVSFPLASIHSIT